MSVLLMKLSGPMQSWGHESRYARRTTGSEPTKSGVLGMLASAQGRRRTDPIADLVDLRFGVRSDQPGRVLEDFQTAHSLSTGKAMPLTYRQYLADATFVAGIEGEREFLEELHSALKSPEYAPFLGRRSFAPAGPVTMGIVETSLQGALAAHPWEASDWFKKRSKGRAYLASVSVDAQGWEDTNVPDLGQIRDDRVQDVPVSWDIKHREYAWRPVRRYWVPLGKSEDKASPVRDWMEALG